MGNFASDKLGAGTILWSPTERPFVAPDGTLYWDVIDENFYIRKFGNWVELLTASSGTGITGTIAANQIAVGSGVNTITGSPNFTFNAGTGTFTVIAPSQPASIILGVAAANPLTIQTRNVGQLLITLGTGAQLNLDPNGLALVGDGNLASTVFTLNSIGGGSASIGVGSFATNPAQMNLPTTTGSSGQVLSTNGANPQQLSWVTRASTASPAFTGTATFVNQSTTGNASFNNVAVQPAVDNATVFTVKNAAGSTTLLAVDTSSSIVTLNSTFVTIKNNLFIGNLLLTSTAPTISSGFGTSPSVTGNNGTAAFRLNVGTGGTATSGVIGLPAANTGWNCFVSNLTARGATRTDSTYQQSSTTTTVTVQNQTTSTGAPLAWTASDILEFICMGF